MQVKMKHTTPKFPCLFAPYSNHYDINYFDFNVSSLEYDFYMTKYD